MNFSYATAFIRNQGILTAAEQDRLRNARVCIAGCGGMGGFYAEALARMGVGSIALADGDAFELANFNRQLGATVPTLETNKAVAIRDRILSINPGCRVDAWTEFIGPENIDSFLAGADLVMNAIEAFDVRAHRLLFGTARERGLTTIFSAPLGLSGVVLVFTPHGMSADRYFDWHDGQDNEEALAAFLVGAAPRALHTARLRLADVDIEQRYGPSHIAACLLGSGWAMAEACHVLAGWNVKRAAPRYVQIDADSGRLASGRLPWGNRSLVQRFKRRFVLNQWRRLHPMIRNSPAQNPATAG